MPTGKFDYAYRLTAARLVILRMRVSRYIRKHFHSEKTASEGVWMSRSALSLGLSAVLLSVGFAAWSGYRWFQETRGDGNAVAQVRASTIDNRQPETTVQQRAAALNGLGSADSVNDVQAQFQATDAVHRSVAPQLTRRSSSNQTETEVLTGKVKELQSSLVIRETENTSLKGLLGQKAAEIDSLRNESRDLARRLQQFEQEKALLEHELGEQKRQFAAAEAKWKASNTERKVVYNITNIPVGAYVPEDQIRTDVQSTSDDLSVQSVIPDEASEVSAQPQEDTQSYLYPFGAEAGDVNSSDPYQEYRDTSGDAVGWKGDDYLSDSLENGLGESDPILLDPNSINDSYDADFVDDPLAPGSSFLGADTVRQEPFYGPAEDRYEDLVEPSMAK